MSQPKKSRAAWSVFFVFILILAVIAILAREMDWPIKKYAAIPEAVLFALIIGMIVLWDWRQMKRRQRKGEQFWLFQALLVLILIALAATVLFIFVPSLAPWA